MLKIFGTSIVFLSCLTGFAEAASAPAQLRGKSIIVSWSEERVQRDVGEANFRSATRGFEFRVYISAAGRVFSRLTAINRKRSGSRDQVGGAGGSTRVADFTGQSMNMIMTGSERGARRVAVNFDAGFGSCRADVVRAKQVGAATMVARSLIRGTQVEIRSVTTSAATCAVQAGNVFGGE